MIVLSPFANGTANRAVGTVKALLENETDKFRSYYLKMLEAVSGIAKSCLEMRSRDCLATSFSGS